MMKEKNLLYLIAIMFFIMSSFISVIFIESRISQKEMNFHWENEQIITRLFQAYINGKSLDSLIENDYAVVNSLGFYNYYGDPIYRFGNAREKFNTVTRTVSVDKKNSTVMIERDFLSPFDPIKRTFSHNNISNLKPSSDWNHMDKEKLIRFVALDVYDNTITFYRVRFRILQFLSVLLILIFIIFILNIYKKNINYRDHIESTHRLVILGTAARTLSHEIKNPLSIIRLQSSIIKRSGCDKHNTSLKIINEEISRITELTERVTDYLRQPKGVPSKLDINRAIIDFINKKNQNITLNSSDKECYAFIDSNRFTSILDNIINNSIESGSHLEEIIISVENSNNDIKISVIDKGKGIPQENIDKLLDPFFTTKSKGSGLGLSIVSSYVNAAEGSLKIKSEELKGTEIKIILPKFETKKG